MKILTGRFKGREIRFRPGPGLRPTADKVRKALADALAGWIEGKSILDLYSGTGALGLELLSAGASTALFVEKDSVRARRIREWLEAAGLQRQTQVWAIDAAAAVRKLARSGRRFELALLDPPYEEKPGAVLDVLAGVLTARSLAVYECRASRPLPELAGFEKVRDKVYGDTRVVIYSFNRPAPQPPNP